MPIADHYRTVIGRGQEMFDLLLADEMNAAEFAKAHNALNDLATLRTAISARPESALLEVSLTEYQYALYALATGQYRHAFVSLRLFMELALSAVQFSAYEIKYRRWSTGNADINWASLVDEQEGVFAHNFISPFSPDLAATGKQYRAMATTVYRELSEYVHGNYLTHVTDEEILRYDGDLSKGWLARASTVRLVVTFAYSARFLKLMSLENRNRVEAVVLGDLGDIPALRAIFEAD